MTVIDAPLIGQRELKSGIKSKTGRKSQKMDHVITFVLQCGAALKRSGC